MSIDDLKIKIFDLINDIDDFDALFEYYSDFNKIVERTKKQLPKLLHENPVDH